MEEKLYRPEEDSRYAEPYIDEEGWREEPVRCYYVHGGWKETELQDQHVKFCFYFPEKEQYEGRFFQYFSPAPEDERESEKASGEEDRISFALTHGGYFVVSNQGGFTMPMAERCYQANAQCAELSRKYAQKIYGYEHRPYGYCYGGSGGSFKTMGAIECTKGIWDGAVPYVLANPMATPNVFAPRVRVMRVLGEEGLKKLVDRMDVGGSGDLYEGLDEYQREALEEATRFGFPKRGWFSWPFMGDGALPVLLPTVYAMASHYFTDFWTKPGYAGSDPNSSEARDRVQFMTTVKELIPRKKPVRDSDDDQLNVDNSWIQQLVGNMEIPDVRLAIHPPEDAYLYHCRFRVMSGALTGTELSVDTIEDGVVRLSTAGISGNPLEGLAVGDQVMIDNSDYLAMQTFQRHQVPDETYTVYDMYRDAEGKPIYPQLQPLVSPMIAYSGSGTIPCGNIHCKTIGLVSGLDESALPWHGDWYRKAVIRSKGSEEDFRLYISDNCTHGDISDLYDHQRMISYVGIRNQALLDVAAWVEKGVEPCRTTSYELVDGQIELPETAQERGGLQPVVRAYANGQKCIHVKVGQRVRFSAVIKTPEGAGKVTGAAWDFEETNDFSNMELLMKSEDGTKAAVESFHIFHKPGVYFPTVKVSSSRTGSLEDIFVQLRNLDRVRVIVEDDE